MSDALKETTSKFMLLYEGPFLISKIYPYSAYELKDENGRAKGKFNKKAFKAIQRRKQLELGSDGRQARGNELPCHNYNKIKETRKME